MSSVSRKTRGPAFLQEGRARAPPVGGGGCHSQMILINNWHSKSTLPGTKQPENSHTNKAAPCPDQIVSELGQCPSTQHKPAPCVQQDGQDPEYPSTGPMGGPGLSPPSSSLACKFPLSLINCSLWPCGLRPTSWYRTGGQVDQSSIRGKEEVLERLCPRASDCSTEKQALLCSLLA